MKELSRRQTKKQRILKRKRDELRSIYEGKWPIVVEGAKDVECRLFDYGWRIAFSVTAPNGNRNGWVSNVGYGKRVDPQYLIQHFVAKAKHWLEQENK